MELAIAALVVVVGALVALIRRDMKRNPSRDWHAEDGAS